jgi:hypothetical protein
MRNFPKLFIFFLIAAFIGVGFLAGPAHAQVSPEATTAAADTSDVSQPAISQAESSVDNTPVIATTSVARTGMDAFYISLGAVLLVLLGAGLLSLRWGLRQVRQEMS